MNESAKLREAEETLRKLGGAMNSAAPEGWGYVLAFFTMGHGGYFTYVSNAERTSMIQGLKELIAKLEAGQGQVTPPGVLGEGGMS